MSNASQFRPHAEEAMRWARQSKTEKVKEAINLARTWTQTASYREHIIWRPSHLSEPGIAAAMLHR